MHPWGRGGYVQHQRVWFLSHFAIISGIVLEYENVKQFSIWSEIRWGNLSLLVYKPGKMFWTPPPND